jgi:hypothetical protein
VAFSRILSLLMVDPFSLSKICDGVHSRTRHYSSASHLQMLHNDMLEGVLLLDETLDELDM